MPCMKKSSRVRFAAPPLKTKNRMAASRLVDTFGIPLRRVLILYKRPFTACLLFESAVYWMRIGRLPIV